MSLLSPTAISPTSNSLRELLGKLNILRTTRKLHVNFPSKANSSAPDRLCVKFTFMFLLRVSTYQVTLQCVHLGHHLSHLIRTGGVGDLAQRYHLCPQMSPAC